LTKSQSARKSYLTLTDLVYDVADILQPQERLTPSQSAEKYRYINNPGSFVGQWSNDTTPYLMEPANCCDDRSYNAVVFVGPAQCGKTDGLLLNWVLHSAVVDPADMLLIEKSQTAARDFSRRRIDRLHRHSKAIGAKLIKRRDSDNTFDKMYSSGMLLTLSYPAINELSGRPVPRVALTDYDRMPENVDGEGSPFDLARKRTTTFRSFAKTLAESSPGYSVDDVRWIPRSAHEAPPCKGILALYNRGDRRRFYWPCPHCGEYFEADFELLDWPDSADLMECAEGAYMRCPHCYPSSGLKITQDKKYDLNLQGVWIRDGQRMSKDGALSGLPTRSDIASFWLKGVAAGFSSWRTLVLNYLKAEQEFERTGSQEALKATVNTDQGKPYYPRGEEVGRLPEDLKARAEDLGERVVPAGVRFLVAMADVQKNAWVVQVFGIGKGFDVWLIDRIKIIKSRRKDEDGDTLWVKPHTYLEDWEILVDDVLQRTYPLADNSGRHMQVRMLTCDSGGKKGVTANAYEFWKRLRDDGDRPGLHKRFVLTKGDPSIGAPRVRVSFPDSGTTKGRDAGARGEVPVLMINTNAIKDMLNAKLDNLKPGAGMIHFPKWMDDEVFSELTVEQKTPKGWENPGGHRNEAWDLFVYCLALCVHLRIEHIDWDNPPGWAQDWDSNDLVFQKDASGTYRFANKEKDESSLASLAARLA